MSSEEFDCSNRPDDHERPYLVYSAGVDWNGLQGTDHRLAAAISKHLPILWIDPPKSIVRGGWRLLLTSGRGRQMRRVSDRIVRLSIAAPPYPDRAATRWLTARIMKYSIRAATRSLAGTPVAMLATCYAPRFNALRPVTYAYYATDDFVAGANLMGISERYLKKATRDQLKHADVVLAISNEMADRLTNQRESIVVLPNGCDPDHFYEVDSLDFPTDVPLRPPIAGLIGQISDRIDMPILAAIAEAGISLLIIGPIDPTFEPEEMARLLSRPNVHWAGSKSFSELPKYMRAIDAGITPYTQSDFNRASFPLKTLEYLSAGRASVATPLPALQRLDSTLVRFASTPSEFVEELTIELNVPRTQAIVNSRRLLAKQHSWDERARALIETLSLNA